MVYITLMRTAKGDTTPHVKFPHLKSSHIKSIKTPHMDDLIRFGKHKGKPLTDLLADVKYCEWLRTQPWLQRYENVYNIIVSNPATDTPTPQHNSIQIKFLDDKFCNIFIENLYNLDLNAIIEKYKGDVDALMEKAEKLVEGEEDTTMVETWKTSIVYEMNVCYHGEKYFDFRLNKAHYYVGFEAKNGADVSLGTNWCGGFIDHRGCIKDSIPVEFSALKDEAKNLSEKMWQEIRANKKPCSSELRGSFRCTYSIEIKPTLGDDYPCVLRQMKKQRLYDK
jgi:hypothetical protein